MKKRPNIFLLAFLILAAIFPTLSASVEAAPEFESKLQGGNDPYTLIAEVNALRAANGLPALVINPILMAVAQAHADYMASTGSVTHYGPGGSRPSERAIAAGYPGGPIFSENIIMGWKLTAQEAVVKWQGDDPHLHTMLGTNYEEIGAGVTEVAGRFYYVIDVGHNYAGAPGSGSVMFTPDPDFTPVFYGPVISTIYPNTPQPNGNVMHKVTSGETLWLIAITYGTKVDAIRALNNLGPGTDIYPGQELLVMQVSVTPAPPTETPALLSTPTLTPTNTTLSPLTPTIGQTPAIEAASPVGSSGALMSGNSMWILVLIVAAAFVLAAVITVQSSRKL